jgi:hypothetical protein
MRRFGHALDPDAADAAAVRRYERRGLTLAPLLDGTLAIRGLADEVTGATIATAIDTAAPLITGDTRTAAQRRLDALTTICRAYLDTPTAHTGGGGHPHLIVTIDEHSLHDQPEAADHPDRAPHPGSPGDPAPGSPGSPGRASGRASGSPGGTLSWIGAIGSATARRVGCDAQLTRVRIGPDGEVPDTAAERRYFTPAQRRAMIARDGDRCPWPWCDRPAAWSDAHHLQHWSAGGPTTVANGALPCPGHHTMLHEGGWTARRLPDGRYLMRHRDGRTIGPEHHPPGHNRPPPHRRQ